MLDDPLAATGDGFGTFPEGINRQGEIVGFYVDSQNIAHGFVYTSATGSTTLDVPAAGTENGAGTVLVSVNSSGVITSTYLDDADVYHGAVISHGSFLYFDAPGAGTAANQGTIPYGITRKGLISGWTLNDSNEISGWLLSHWQFSPLNDPLAATGPNLGSALYGINAQGSGAAGQYWDAFRSDAWLRGHALLSEPRTGDRARRVPVTRDEYPPAPGSRRPPARRPASPATISASTSPVCASDGENGCGSTHPPRFRRWRTARQARRRPAGAVRHSCGLAPPGCRALPSSRRVPGCCRRACRPAALPRGSGAAMISITSSRPAINRDREARRLSP